MPGRHDVAVPEPIRVAFTLEQCWHAVPGGSAVAAIELGRHLAGRDDVSMIGVAGRHRNAPARAFTPPFHVAQLPIARPWLYETWNRFGRPRVERATGVVDVCHSTVAIPAGTRAPHVVTVHDVAFVHEPERFTRHGARVMRHGLERCRRADRIVCPSHATRIELEQLGFDSARIRVVPWGVAVADVPDERVRAVRERYRLPDGFVLFVGTVEPRKNLARLAEATVRAGRQLVVAGSEGWGEQRPGGDATRFLGFVPGDELAALYRAAGVFAYPSLREGFGMPISEAMAHGVPVVTSAGSATEEVAGGAAVLVDPNSVESIADGIVAAFDRRAELVTSGRARVAQLTWEAAAESTASVYRELVS
jgi:glycosyltransferase involved in cell wall biosynthesis